GTPRSPRMAWAVREVCGGRRASTKSSAPGLLLRMGLHPRVRPLARLAAISRSRLASGLSASERSACTSAGLAAAAFPSALHLRLVQSGELVDLWDCVGSA